MAYQRVDFGGRHGRLDEPAYIARNPNHRLPGSRTMAPSSGRATPSWAISQRATARASSGTGTPAGGTGRSVDGLDADDAGARFLRRLLGRGRPAAEPGQGRCRSHLKSLGEHFALLDRQLEPRPFLSGDKTSMADMVDGATFYRYHEMEIERPALPRLTVV